MLALPSKKGSCIFHCPTENLPFVVHTNQRAFRRCFNSVFCISLLSPLAVSILHIAHSIENPYSKGKWTEKSLIKDLLHDYEKRARPVVDNKSPVIQLGDLTVQQITVGFGLGLIQILDLNENEQTLTVSVKSLYRWPDYHLVWNPEEYENITHITIPTDKIWIPDIALYN
ncbi:Neuronal acetylcholine receptor subunit alpha-2 [Fasciola gigantica]|uniref:Neuronal acetylcholine receptor subunit alpha-2 n=1 Tax=Fasciola gigantica TaxID=46835 RepID=A0A504YMS1_FASGI|nr:Neuronal acetylcholine receptor subunit alpha-2 [Fasciola gigantica]